MPIKFRCTHCNQLLGISHRKAGATVNCPACGAAVQVPLTSPVGPQQSSAPRRARPGGDEFERALEAAAQALEPPPSVADHAPAPELVVNPPPPSPAQEPFALGPPDAVPLPESALPEIALGGAVTSHPCAHTRTLFVRSWPVWAGLAAAAALALTFLAGYWSATRSASPPPPTTEASPPPAQTVTARLADPPKPPPPPPRRPAAMHGRITYTQAGIAIADDRARLIALPTKQTPDEPLRADGLRPGEDLPVNLGGDALRKLGGAHTSVATDGRYHLTLPTPGVYLLVVLSYHTHRDLTERLPPGDEERLARYFAEPRDLLGWHKYVLAEATLADEQPLAWNYDFGMDDGPR